MIDFSDLIANKYHKIELSDIYYAMVSKVWKKAFVYDHRKDIAEKFDRGVIGLIWLDHTGAWNVEYAISMDGKDKTTYLPINDVLPLIGYKAIDL